LLGGLALGAVWDHSMQTPVCYKIIASHERLDGRMPGESFVAGMLHGTGKLVIASNNPEKYQDAIQKSDKIGIAAAEEEVFGVNHADIGGHLFALWGLPISVVDAIEFHHEPSTINQTEVSILALVHAANVIVNQQHEETVNPDSICADEAYLSAVGLKDHYQV
jgi:HD-like signal output (HDOD) protein